MDSNLREAQLKRAAAFLSSVSVVHRQPPPKRAEPALPAECVNLLVKAGLEPDKCLMDLYSDLNLHPAKAKQAISTIEAQALGRVHVLARKGRGGGPHGLEVLEAGREVLRTHGITPAAKVVGRGGWAHDVYGRWIGKWARLQGLTCWFEHRVGHKVFDVATRDREGQLVGYEIMLSGSVSMNATQSSKALEVAGMHEVVLAAEDAKLLKQLKVHLEKGALEAGVKDGKKPETSRVRYVLLGEYSPFGRV